MIDASNAKSYSCHELTAPWATRSPAHRRAGPPDGCGPLHWTPRKRPRSIRTRRGWVLCTFRRANRPLDLQGAQKKMNRIFAYILAVLAVAYAGLREPAYADSVPFWGARESVAAGTPISQLKKGEFLWMADAVSSGPIVMVVSITEQKAYVYRNGVLIG